MLCKYKNRIEMMQVTNLSFTLKKQISFQLNWPIVTSPLSLIVLLRTTITMSGKKTVLSEHTKLPNIPKAVLLISPVFTKSICLLIQDPLQCFCPEWIHSVLNVFCSFSVYDSGTLFEPEILDITDDDIRARFLSVSIGIFSTLINIV